MKKNQTQNKTNFLGLSDHSFSVIYSKKNEPPKYFKLKKSTLLIFLVLLPTISIVSLGIGTIGLVFTSPFHLVTNIKRNYDTHKIESKIENLMEESTRLKEEKEALNNQVKELSDKLLQQKPIPGSDESSMSIDKPAKGMSLLNLINTNPNANDLSNKNILNITGISTNVGRDVLHFQFNIIPNENNEEKTAGFIHVIMKGDNGLSFYPSANQPATYQIHFNTGESFATQKFRPVDATFLLPKKSGTYLFSVFIFNKAGDLIFSKNQSMSVSL